VILVGPAIEDNLLDALFDRLFGDIGADLLGGFRLVAPGLQRQGRAGDQGLAGLVVDDLRV